MFMRLRAIRVAGTFAIVSCIALLVGCSGAGSGISGTSRGSTALMSAVAHSWTTQTTEATTLAPGNVTFRVGITPRKIAGRIAPKYISPSTQSLQILTDGANALVVNLTPSSPNCAPNPAAAGSFICTAALKASAGDHVFTLTMYDLTGAQGNVLSTNTTGVIDVKPTGPNTISIVLQGAVHEVILWLANTNPPLGTKAAIDVTAIVEDADDNLIIGPAPYEYPVTLTTTDAVNGPLSKTTLRSPADAAGLVVNYSGAKVGAITYSASATGLAAADAIPVELTPGQPAQHLYVANAGDNSVIVFNLSNPSLAPTRITGGNIAGPRGIALDTSGKLYVANGGAVQVGEDAAWISIFDTAHGNAVLPPLGAGGFIVYPDGIAVDKSSKLYVVNYGDIYGQVSVFDTLHGNASLPAISGGLYYPMGVAVDAAGRLYVTSYHGQIDVFDTLHGGAALPTITGAALFDPVAVALDASGRLYIANFDGSSVSVVDTAHGDAVLPTIYADSLIRPIGVALDATGKLYVSNNVGNTVSVFDTAHGNVELPAITGNGLSFPTGIAVH